MLNDSVYVTDRYDGTYALRCSIVGKDTLTFAIGVNLFGNNPVGCKNLPHGHLDVWEESDL